MINNNLTCLFGFHNYSKKLTKDRDGFKIYLCTICKRNGYFKYDNGYALWTVYDNKGNNIHWKDNKGKEAYKDDKGHWIHVR